MLRYMREVVLPQAPHRPRYLEVGAAKFATRQYAREDVIGSGLYTALDVRALKHHRRLEVPHGFVRGSVTQLPFPDDTFDVVLCNNTLTYVREYEAALMEMCRCLKTDGLAMLHTHRELDFSRTAAQHRIAEPGLGDEWFAENGDEWVFGMDFFDRLADAGFAPRLDRPSGDLSLKQHERFGLKPGFELVVAFKSDAGSQRYSPPGA